MKERRSKPRAGHAHATRSQSGFWIDPLMAPKRPTEETAQHKSFTETARGLECDESEDVFDKALKKIGKAKPVPVKKLRERN